jgi:hypothetical protein
LFLSIATQRRIEPSTSALAFCVNRLRGLADVGHLLAGKVIAETLCLGCIQVQRLRLPDEINIGAASSSGFDVGDVVDVDENIGLDFQQLLAPSFG